MKQWMRRKESYRDENKCEGARQGAAEVVDNIFWSLIKFIPAKVQCKVYLVNLRAHGAPICIKTAHRYARAQLVLVVSAQV